MLQIQEREYGPPENFGVCILQRIVSSLQAVLGIRDILVRIRTSDQ
jgi:hypothetical protein